MSARFHVLPTGVEKKLRNQVVSSEFRNHRANVAVWFLGLAEHGTKKLLCAPLTVDGPKGGDAQNGAGRLLNSQ